MTGDGARGDFGASRATVNEDVASTSRCSALIVVRIGNFANLRRRLGIARANLLAGLVARRLIELAPNADVTPVGRDRIDVMLTDCCEQTTSAAIDEIAAAFRTPFDMDDDRCLLELVIGAAITSGDHADEICLMDEAEHAVEEARDKRSVVLRVLHQGPRPGDCDSLSRDLRDAISKGELFLQYQPKLHLRRQAITGVEALVRWRHPARGLVMPNDFIALAEQSHDIIDLTVWTIQQVIEDQRALTARGFDLPVFVNISAVLLSDTRFVRRACALVQSSDAKIGFEVTETAVIRDAESAIAHLKMFAEIGIIVAIDDYGAGLSSLAYLKRLPARELKIDKLFVTQLTSSNRDPLIVRSTIDLAHAMEMEVVAEGVETAAALALLSVMGCDMAQGFYISRPLDLPVLLDFLASDRAKEIAHQDGGLLNFSTALRRAS